MSVKYKIFRFTNYALDERNLYRTNEDGSFLWGTIFKWTRPSMQCCPQTHKILSGTHWGMAATWPNLVYLVPIWQTFEPALSKTIFTLCCKWQHCTHITWSSWMAHKHMDHIIFHFLPTKSNHNLSKFEWSRIYLIVL